MGVISLRFTSNHRLYGIILHGFMTNYQATEEFLVSHNVLAQVVRQTLENISDFKMNYDKKVNNSPSLFT